MNEDSDAFIGSLPAIKLIRALRKARGISRATAWRWTKDTKIPRNIVGRRFGALVVVGMTDKVNRLNEPFWLLQCDCGKQIESTAWVLRAGARKHCGCNRGAPPSKKRINKTVGQLTGDRWARILRAAQGRGLKVALTQEEAWQLFIQQNGRCALTNQELTIDIAALRAHESPARWVHRDIARLLAVMPEPRLLVLARQLAALPGAT